MIIFEAFASQQNMNSSVTEIHACRGDFLDAHDSCCGITSLAAVAIPRARDAHLPTELYGGTYFGLLQRKGDLLFRKFRLLHGTTSYSS